MSVLLAQPCPLADLVDRYGGELDEALRRRNPIVAVLGPSWPGPGPVHLVPILDARALRFLRDDVDTVLVSEVLSPRLPSGRRWVHPEAGRVLAKLLEAPTLEPFGDDPIHPNAKVDPSAIVEPGARIGRDVLVGPEARICSGAILYPGVSVDARVVVGPNSVVGRPGFGFAPGTPPLRYPHRCGVVLEVEVELGALCSIDAGILAPTRVGARTKLDAQVHVGHGVVIGKDTRMAAQVGLAGSVTIGDGVLIGGQVGVADHISVGEGARIAAKAGVIGDVPAGGVFAGYPAVPRLRWLRGHAYLYRGRRGG